VDTTSTLSEDKDTLHAILYFSYAKHNPYEFFERLLPYHNNPRSALCADIDDGNCETSFSLETTTQNYDTTYSVVYPPFALLVGGPIANPWVEAIVVLGDQDTTTAFEALHSVDTRLVRSWTTRQRLSSLLAQIKTLGPLDFHKFGRATQLVMCYEHFNTLHVSGEVCEIQRTCLHVDAQVTMVSKDLVQHQLALIIEVAKVGDDRPPPGQEADANQKWWAWDSTDK
jgi:hypothetical protein